MLLVVALRESAAYGKPVSAIYLQCMLNCNLTCAKFKLTTWESELACRAAKAPTSLPCGNCATYATFAMMA